MRRSRPNQRKARKQFSRTAKRVHKKNGMGRPKRGGIRL
jgi:hypothetical protein